MTENTTSGKSLTELNWEEAKRYYGFIVFMGIIFVPGVIGNAHILHIYIFKKKPSNTRVYVCFMAALDMTNCVVNYPFHVVNCFLPYMFYSDEACKIFNFVTFFVNISIPLCLLVISVDRFRIICKPFEAQMSERLCRIICGSIFVSSIIISIPCPFLHGSVPIDTGTDGIVGFECNLSDSSGLWTVIYIGALSGMTIIEAIVLIVLYSLMGVTIRRQQNLLKNSGLDYMSNPSRRFDTNGNQNENNVPRRINTLPRSFRPSCETENDIKVFTELRDANKLSASVKDTTKPRPKSTLSVDNLRSERNNKLNVGEIKQDAPSFGTSRVFPVFQHSESPETAEKSRMDAVCNGKTSESRVKMDPRISRLKQQLNISSRSDPFNDKREVGSFKRLTNIFKRKERSSIQRKREEEKENFKGTKRVTYMFFWVTFLYIVSYLPNPALRVSRYFDEDWYDSIGFSGQIVYHLVLGSVFLVSATNFFIYLFCDSYFRRDVRQWYRNVLCKFCRRK